VDATWLVFPKDVIDFFLHVVPNVVISQQVILELCSDGEISETPLDWGLGDNIVQSELNFHHLQK
jgi:hypothetical protein